MAADVRRYTSDARRYIEAALGNLTPSGARELARSMVERGQDLAGQGPSGMANQIRDVAQQLMDWSQQSRENVMEVVQREIRRQLKSLGLATSEDVDALRKRVRDLEKAAGGGGGARTTTAKRSPAKKRSSTRKSTSTAKRSTAKRTSSGGSSSSASSGSGGSSSSSDASSGSGSSSGSSSSGGESGGSSGAGGDGS